LGYRPPNEFEELLMEKTGISCTREITLTNPSNHRGAFGKVKRHFMNKVDVVIALSKFVMDMHFKNGFF